MKIYDFENRKMKLQMTYLVNISSESPVPDFRSVEANGETGHERDGRFVTNKRRSNRLPNRLIPNSFWTLILIFEIELRLPRPILSARDMTKT